MALGLLLRQGRRADEAALLGRLLAERDGRIKTAIASYARALAQARHGTMLGAELRAE